MSRFRCSDKEASEQSDHLVYEAHGDHDAVATGLPWKAGRRATP